jgi:hypothetical protein
MRLRASFLGCVSVVLLATSSSTALASASLVQNNTATGTTSVAAKWTSAVTAGHLLVATVTAASGSTLGAPSGWTAIASIDNPTKVMVAMYYVENCGAKAANTTETFTATGSNGTTVRLMEFAGIVTSGSLDTSGTASGGATTAASVTTSGSVSSSPSLGVAILSHQIADVPNFTATSPYVDVSGYIMSANNLEDTVYNTSVAIGGTSKAAVSGTGHSWAAAIAVFQEAPLYWRGGLGSCPSGSLFTNTACWSATSGGASATVAPGMSDRAIFDGNATGDCALSPTATTQAGSITTTPAYTGTITQDVQNVQLTSDLSIGGGTFRGRAGQTITTSGNIVVSGGGAFDGNGAATSVQSLYVQGGTFTAGAGNFSTGAGGVAVFSGGASTFSTGTSSFASTLSTSGASTSLTFGAGAPTVTGLATFSGGTVTFGAGQLLLNGGLDVEGGTVTLGASASTTTVTGTATVGGGTLNLTNGAAASDFSSTLALTQSGGTINVNAAAVVFGSTITTGSNDAFIMSGGVFNNLGGALAVGTAGGGGGNFDQTGASATYVSTGGSETFNGRLFVSGSTTVGTASMAGTAVATRKDVFINVGGTLTLSSAGFAFSGPTAMTIAGTLNAGTGTAAFSPALTVTGTLDGSSGTQTFANTLTVGGLVKTGTASMTGGTAATRLVTINAGGTMTLGTAGFTFNSTTAMPLAGTLNAAGPTSFAGPVTLSGTYNAGASTTTFSGIVTMSGGSAFNGNTGRTTFSVAPTLTAGTFTVGDASTAGWVSLVASTTFTSGMTLVFPARAGELKVGQGTTLTIQGTVQSNVDSGATLPKIDCAACTAAQSITVTLSGTPTLNVNGLELDNLPAAGLTLPSTTVYTRLKRLKFANSATGATNQLTLTLGTQVLNMPGCYFDGSATHNVTLNGTSGQERGARVIMEYQSASVNGNGAGESFDVDGDNGTNGDTRADDGYVDGATLPSPYYGSVVEWVKASPTDTAGAAVGYPTAAFDWNTFTFYGVYAAYKDTAGAGSSDVIWMRNVDGSPAYSFTVPQASGDIVGTPYWDTINETLAHVDANGDGDQADTDVRVVYVATSTGGITKLVDNGASLARPAGGPWATDFTSTSVSTITSPLSLDGTNLYFGGTSSGSPMVFAVQVAGGTGEATLQRSVAGVSAITTEPSWTVSGGTTFLYLGSTATAGQAYIYRIDMTTGTTVTSFSGVTDTVNGSMALVNGRAYAATDGGKIHALDALNFNTGGFVNVSGFPYQTAAAKPIKQAPEVEFSTGASYFGDDGGNLYYLGSDGVLATGYPLALTSTNKITSTPMYLTGGGVIAVGADDGYLYFVDRNNGAGPSVFKRYFVTSNNNSVSSVSYDAGASMYMVSSSDGHLTYINAADVIDPTPGTI